MDILVAGGAGFIGSHLCDALLTAGHAVWAVDNLATGRRENLAPLADVEIVEGDVQSYERVHHAVAGCDTVFHMAALPSVPRSIQDPLTSHAINVTGTLNLLLCARDANVRRVVLASSSSVYGSNPDLPKREDMPPLPISPYGVAKLASEGYMRSFTQVYGLETVSLRYFNVFGPRQDPLSQYSAAIPRFIAALRAGDSPVVFGDGEQSRDFTYVSNVVEATALAMEARGVAGQVFNVAFGRSITVNGLLRELGSVLGVDVAAEHVAGRTGDVRHSLADCTRAREALGYEPRIDLEEGLRLTVEHYQSDGVPVLEAPPR
jgi:nucleoside-diphosphate-sugar epimerase